MSLPYLYIAFYSDDYVLLNDLTGLHLKRDDRPTELIRELFQKMNEVSLNQFPKPNPYQPEHNVFNMHTSASRSLYEYRHHIGSSYESDDRYAVERLYAQYGRSKSYLPAMLIARTQNSVNRVECYDINYVTKYMYEAIA